VKKRNLLITAAAAILPVSIIFFLFLKEVERESGSAVLRASLSVPAAEGTREAYSILPGEAANTDRLNKKMKKSEEDMTRNNEMIAKAKEAAAARRKAIMERLLKAESAPREEPERLRETADDAPRKPVSNPTREEMEAKGVSSY
jgi:hypothetical protein